MNDKVENLKGKNFALTILLGVFIAIMVSILFNLIVEYAYEPPQYDMFCKSVMGVGNLDIKYIPEQQMLASQLDGKCLNCTFSKSLQSAFDNCTANGGTPITEYDEKGCMVALKACDMCYKNYDDAMKIYNRNAFFIYAVIGFMLIVVGLFTKPLLIQIATLPSGAVSEHSCLMFGKVSFTSFTIALGFL